ncbi:MULTISPECIES: hypothetical protein [unclassified Anabaena]|uniref:hypothetical protein n=1 Tax=unclassified Anabaena TaxID=2619674 RepID=UPI0039C67F1D
MSRALIEDIFNEPEWSEETAFPATDKELLILTQQLSGFEVPIKVFLQAVAIAAYDCESAFRYADNYLTMVQRKNKGKSKNLLLFRTSPNFANN